ncbi:entericidin A/B family lipoprotein [Niveispirillum sp. KHB5.9]
MNKRSIAIPAALLLSMFALSACNTVEGVGKDVKSGGKAIENTAQDAKN